MRFAALLLALTLAACSSDETTYTVETYTPEAPGDAERTDAERGVMEYFATNYGVALTSLECPPMPDVGRVTCQTSAEGFDFETEVTQKPNGEASIVPVAFISRQAVQTVTTLMMRQTFGEGLDADCDMPVAMRTTIGETLLCEVTEPSGEAHTIQVRFDDDRGDFNLQKL